MIAMATSAVLQTFVGALGFGILAQIVAQKLRLSAIVVLLVAGVLLGPTYFNLVQPESLGQGLQYIVSLAVSLILFEGGLTLDLHGFRKASKEIRGVLSWGVLVTWLCTAVILKVAFALTWALALLAGSLVIVTGPTVIAPLLKRIRVKHRLHHILHWEGVLIDAIGVFISLLCYEWILSGEAALLSFLGRIVVGFTAGLAAGLLLSFIMQRRWVPESNLNTFALAAAVSLFALCDQFAHETGLLAVTIAGLTLGWRKPPGLDRLIEYKTELSHLLIGLLFILLAARLDLASFQAQAVVLTIVVALVMFVVRPLNIFVSTIGSDLSLKEKLFLSWVAPRGIVAASMASVFTLRLSQTLDDPSQALILETFTYSVIGGTVVLQGFTAGLVGRALGVLEPIPKGWLVVGANRVGLKVAAFIQECGHPVVVVDSNTSAINRARRQGLSGLATDALHFEPDEYAELYGIGHVLAITENEELNQLVAQRFRKELPNAEHYYWSQRESKEDGELGTGTKVWTRFSLQALITRPDREVGFSESLNVEEVVEPEHVLLCFHNDQITPFLPEQQNGPAMVLYDEPVERGLSLDLRADWLMISHARTMPELFSELIGKLQQSGPELDYEAIGVALNKREDEYTSLIGQGVALPHLTILPLDRPLALFAKMTKPVPCRHSGDQINFVFLLLSPKNQPAEHLKALSEIARFIMKDHVREGLEEASSASDLSQIFGLTCSPPTQR